MQQAPQYPQRQAMMQGHQMQPGQQAYPLAYQNAGCDKCAEIPCSLKVFIASFNPVSCLQIALRSQLCTAPSHLLLKKSVPGTERPSDVFPGNKVSS